MSEEMPESKPETQDAPSTFGGRRPSFCSSDIQQILLDYSESQKQQVIREFGEEGLEQLLKGQTNDKEQTTPSKP